jgi:hypothetical protein
MTKLTRWKTPDSYFGAEWPEYYVFLSQHRDSDALTRSNFICGLEAIGGGASETVHVVRELSIFAARRDYLPYDDSGMLVDYLRG